MSAFTGLKEAYGRRFTDYLSSLRKYFFGVNNERLDFFMDSFHKLSPKQRVGVVGGLISVIIGFVIGAVVIYMMRVSALEAELGQSFEALSTLRSMRVDDKVIGDDFNTLLDSIKKKTSGLVLKPFFEKLSRSQGVEITNLREDKLDLEASNPMSNEIKMVKFSMKIPKISIPKLMTFLVEIEKSDKYLRVHDLKITGLYGNKLYFDVALTVRGYSPAH